jgi:hypothetical protein
MTTPHLRPSERTRPFVAVVCAVPLLGEAVRSALDFADVQTFAANGGDLDGLLRWLRPDALIVDHAESAEQATPFAVEHELPVVHLSVAEPLLRIHRRGAWEVIGNGEGPTPEAIRNIVAGAVFARAGAAT